MKKRFKTFKIERGQEIYDDEVWVELGTGRSRIAIYYHQFSTLTGLSLKPGESKKVILKEIK